MLIRGLHGPVLDGPARPAGGPARGLHCVSRPGPARAMHGPARDLNFHFPCCARPVQGVQRVHVPRVVEY